jgi:hypothetical protein
MQIRAPSKPGPSEPGQPNSGVVYSTISDFVFLNSTISDFVFFTCSRGQVMQVTPALDWRNLLQMLFFSPHSRPSCVASAPVNVTPSECNARSVACIKQREGIYNLVDKDNVVTLCNCKFRRIWAEGHPSHGVVLWPLSIGLPKISRHLSKA